jgi:hypothetical protein
MDKAKPIKTLMCINGHLDLDICRKLVDQKIYRSIIDFLLYLCASRPDIMLSVCMCKILNHTQEMPFEGC